jgi:hypothetical protein
VEEWRREFLGGGKGGEVGVDQVNRKVEGNGEGEEVACPGP